MAQLWKLAGRATPDTVPLADTPFWKFSTCAPVNSEKAAPSTLAYTRSELLRSPVGLSTVAQSKPSVPASTPEKSTKKSTATDVVLSEDPVHSSSNAPLPFCLPPVLPLAQLVLAVVRRVAAGIVPEPPAGKPAKRLAPAPEPKSAAQFATSANDST